MAAAVLMPTPLVVTSNSLWIQFFKFTDPALATSSDVGVTVYERGCNRVCAKQED